MRYDKEGTDGAQMLKGGVVWGVHTNLTIAFKKESGI